MDRTTIIDFEHPDETRTFGHGQVDIVHAGSSSIARLTFQPGWHWATDVKPIAGTNSCQVRHVGMVVSGHLHVKMDDGTELDLHPGDTYIIAPGHDGSVVGKETMVALEFSTPAADSFAKKRA